MKNCTLAALSVLLLSGTTAGVSVQSCDVCYGKQRFYTITTTHCTVTTSTISTQQAEPDMADMPSTAWANKMMVW